MSLSLVKNVDSIKAQGQLKRTTQTLSKTYERLSSGLRINSASDDPAGLQVANKLQTDAKLASVAIRNGNDGLSLTAIADSALNEIGSILSRLGELAQQSANGTYTTSQRQALSSEFLALGSEIERIAKTTTFNGLNLLSNTSSISIQVGIDGSANSSITLNPVTGTLSALGLGNAGGALTYSIISSSTAGSTDAANNALSAVNNAITTLGNSRGTLGAAESRLSSAISFITVARENYLAAESRIRDADIAAEVAEMVRLQVLQQATTAIIAQANQQPQIVLSLLQ